MKKTIFLLSAAALMVAASCTKIETETPDQEITFSVANYSAQTRAEASLLDENINSFKCKAYMVGEGVQTVQDFFGTAGETISWNVTNTVWAPSHTYYWPKSANSYVNFFSWYDTGNGPAVTNGTMKWENRVIGTGDNIMYADPAWRFKQNNNPATYTTVDGVAEGVPTLFHHALSQVEFRVYASELEQSGLVTWTVKLTGIELKVNNKGTLSLTATEPTSGNNIKGTWDGTPAWVASGDKGNIMPTTFNVTATSATADAAKLLANQSVLPQDLTGVNLVFKLDITTTYAAGETNQEVIAYSIPLAAAVADGGFNTAKWDLNTKYIYTIKISPSTNEVLFDPAVETAWTVVDAGEKEL